MANEELMPSDVTYEVSKFDRFSSRVSNCVSKAWFFSACVLSILLWLPSYWVFSNKDSWELVVNTFTTILTFLLLALLTNTQSRETKAINHKLNAIADGLADLMEYTATTCTPDTDAQLNRLQDDLVELRRAVGIERYESA